MLHLCSAIPCNFIIACYQILGLLKTFAMGTIFRFYLDRCIDMLRGGLALPWGSLGVCERLFLGTFQDQLNWLILIGEL